MDNKETKICKFDGCTIPLDGTSDGDAIILSRCHDPLTGKWCLKITVDTIPDQDAVHCTVPLQLTCFRQSDSPCGNILELAAHCDSGSSQAIRIDCTEMYHALCPANTPVRTGQFKVNIRLDCIGLVTIDYSHVLPRLVEQCSTATRYEMVVDRKTLPHPDSAVVDWMAFERSTEDPDHVWWLVEARVYIHTDRHFRFQSRSLAPHKGECHLMTSKGGKNACTLASDQCPKMKDNGDGARVVTKNAEDETQQFKLFVANLLVIMSPHGASPPLLSCERMHLYAKLMPWVTKFYESLGECHNLTSTEVDTEWRRIWAPKIIADFADKKCMSVSTYLGLDNQSIIRVDSLGVPAWGAERRQEELERSVRHWKSIRDSMDSDNAVLELVENEIARQEEWIAAAGAINTTSAFASFGQWATLFDSNTNNPFMFAPHVPVVYPLWVWQLTQRLNPPPSDAAGDTSERYSLPPVPLSLPVWVQQCEKDNAKEQLYYINWADTNYRMLWSPVSPPRMLIISDEVPALVGPSEFHAGRSETVPPPAFVPYRIDEYDHHGCHEDHRTSFFDRMWNFFTDSSLPSQTTSVVDEKFNAAPCPSSISQSMFPSYDVDFGASWLQGEGAEDSQLVSSSVPQVGAFIDDDRVEKNAPKVLNSIIQASTLKSSSGERYTMEKGTLVLTNGTIGVVIDEPNNVKETLKISLLQRMAVPKSYNTNEVFVPSDSRAMLKAARLLAFDTSEAGKKNGDKTWFMTVGSENVIDIIPSDHPRSAALVLESSSSIVDLSKDNITTLTWSNAETPRELGDSKRGSFFYYQMISNDTDVSGVAFYTVDGEFKTLTRNGYPWLVTIANKTVLQHAMLMPLSLDSDAVQSALDSFLGAVVFYNHDKNQIERIEVSDFNAIGGDESGPIDITFNYMDNDSVSNEFRLTANVSTLPFEKPYYDVFSLPASGTVLDKWFKQSDRKNDIWSVRIPDVIGVFVAQPNEDVTRISGIFDKEEGIVYDCRGLPLDIAKMEVQPFPVTLSDKSYNYPMFGAEAFFDKLKVNTVVGIYGWNSDAGPIPMYVRSGREVPAELDDEGAKKYLIEVCPVQRSQTSNVTFIVNVVDIFKFPGSISSKIIDILEESDTIAKNKTPTNDSIYNFDFPQQLPELHIVSHQNGLKLFISENPRDGKHTNIWGVMTPTGTVYAAVGAFTSYNPDHILEVGHSGTDEDMRVYSKMLFHYSTTPGTKRHPNAAGGFSRIWADYTQTADQVTDGMGREFKPLSDQGGEENSDSDSDSDSDDEGDDEKGDNQHQDQDQDQDQGKEVLVDIPDDLKKKVNTKDKVMYEIEFTDEYGVEFYFKIITSVNYAYQQKKTFYDDEWVDMEEDQVYVSSVMLDQERRSDQYRESIFGDIEGYISEFPFKFPESRPDKSNPKTGQLTYTEKVIDQAKITETLEDILKLTDSRPYQKSDYGNNMRVFYQVTYSGDSNETMIPTEYLDQSDANLGAYIIGINKEDPESVIVRTVDSSSTSPTWNDYSQSYVSIQTYSRFEFSEKDVMYKILMGIMEDDSDNDNGDNKKDDGGDKKGDGGDIPKPKSYTEVSTDLTRITIRPGFRQRIDWLLTQQMAVDDTNGELRLFFTGANGKENSIRYDTTYVFKVGPKSAEFFVPIRPYTINYNARGKVVKESKFFIGVKEAPSNYTPFLSTTANSKFEFQIAMEKNVLPFKFSNFSQILANPVFRYNKEVTVTGSSLHIGTNSPVATVHLFILRDTVRNRLQPVGLSVTFFEK